MIQRLLAGGMMHRLWKKIMVFLLSMGLVLNMNNVRANAEEMISEPGQLYALSACLMDADSGRVLYEKEGNVHRANASTTKIMTLILTLERANPGETVTVSKRAASCVIR